VQFVFVILTDKRGRSQLITAHDVYRDGGGLYKVRSGLQRSKLRTRRSKEQRGGRFREMRTKKLKKVLTMIQENLLHHPHRHVWKARHTFLPPQTDT